MHDLHSKSNLNFYYPLVDFLKACSFLKLKEITN